MTVHAAKGLEFDRVVVIGLGSTMPVAWGDPAEERCIEYVAVTRAKNRLCLVATKDHLDGRKA